MEEKTVMLHGTIEIKYAYDLEKGTNPLLVCVDDFCYESRKQFMFVDELVIGDTKYIVPKRK